MKKIISLVAFAALMVGMSVSAEETSAGKSYSLDITVPDNDGATVGGRLFLDSELAVEASGTFQISDEDKDTGVADGTRLFVAAGIMKYLSKGRVSPYMHAGAGIEILSGDRYDNQDSNLRGYAGVGAEFMITDELSLRASADAMLKTSPFTIATFTNDLTLSFLF